MVFHRLVALRAINVRQASPRDGRPDDTYEISGSVCDILRKQEAIRDASRAPVDIIEDLTKKAWTHPKWAWVLWGLIVASAATGFIANVLSIVEFFQAPPTADADEAN